MWEVEYTDEFEEWFVELSADEQESIAASVELLGELGPGLARPLADTVRSSRLSNLKELRPAAGSIRILFAFDPRRTAILLIGGNKRGRWNEWYRRMIPYAEELYDEHLRELRREGLIDAED